ncbi:MAG: HNH endonuclease [Steroidobacteraceae bacterium]
MTFETRAGMPFPIELEGFGIEAVDTQSDLAAAAADTSRNVRYWWVNHKRTHLQELGGEFLWSPKRKQGGADSESPHNMTKIMPGDVVFAFSFAEAAVRAVGVALGCAREAPNPFEVGTRQRGGQRGWQVTVRFADLTHPWQPKDHAVELARVLPEKNSPLRAGGDPNPAIYLACVPQKMAAALRRMVGAEIDTLVEQITQRAGSHFPDDVEEEALLQRTDLAPAAKLDLLKARRGQGVYRANLEGVESACRLTGLLDRRHLRATHIKPWRKSGDAEKLDGCNGLLLSPHLEHLFCRGYISFSDAGELLVSRYLNPAVLDKWGLRLPRYVDPFRPEQCRYLDYHRLEIFERHVGGRRKSLETAVEDPLETEPGAPLTVYEGE